MSRPHSGIAATLARHPLAVFLLLALALFLLRSIVTFPVEHVDSSFKYLAAADLVRGAGLERLLENQHTMRWSEVLPQVVVTWATDFSYFGLYVLPLLAFALTGALLWAGLRDSLSLPQQALLLALLFIEPLGLQHTGQLLNPPFGVLYAVLGITVLVRGKRPDWTGTVLAALCFFAAYGAHSTYLAFAAGPFFWLAILARKPVLAIGFATLIAILMGLETLFFNAIAPDPLSGGRLESLAGSGHMSMVKYNFPAVEPLELLTRWFRLPVFGMLVTGGYLAVVISLLLRKRLATAPPFLVLAIMTGGAYAAAVSLAVVSLDPLRPFMPLRPMYLEPFMPFAILASVYGFAQLENRLSTRWQRTLEVAGVAFMALLLVFAAQQKAAFDALVNSRLNAFAWKADAQFTDLAERFAAGEIILAGDHRHALVKLFAYTTPFTVRYVPRTGMIRVPPMHDAPLCLRGVRKVPLERNLQACGPWQQERLEADRDARERRPR